MHFAPRGTRTATWAFSFGASSVGSQQPCAPISWTISGVVGRRRRIGERRGKSAPVRDNFFVLSGIEVLGAVRSP
jgi:hypothetical protein